MIVDEESDFIHQLAKLLIRWVGIWTESHGQLQFMAKRRLRRPELTIHDLPEDMHEIEAWNSARVKCFEMFEHVDAMMMLCVLSVDNEMTLCQNSLDFYIAIQVTWERQSLASIVAYHKYSSYFLVCSSGLNKLILGVSRPFCRLWWRECSMERARTQATVEVQRQPLQKRIVVGCCW